MACDGPAQPGAPISLFCQDCVVDWCSEGKNHDGRKSRDSYSDALGLREVETDMADTFEAEFPVVTGRAVRILSTGPTGDAPDRIALIDGIETGLELTAVKSDGAEQVIEELLRLARKKHESYERRGIFKPRPTMLLADLGWPTLDIEGAALYDVRDDLVDEVCASDFSAFGFSETWLMDDGPKYTSRADPRASADLFCFAPADKVPRALNTARLSQLH
jgi:hypothetical protein